MLDNEESLKRFVDADWEQLSLRLVKYALFKVRRLEWKTGNFLPKGMLPEDIALDAIRKTCEGLTEPAGTTHKKGVRIWDPEKQPDLFEFLKGVVDSDVNALVMSAEHRLTDYSADIAPEEAESRMLRLAEAPGQVSAEEILIRKESRLNEEARLERLMEELYGMCADNEEELLVLLAFKEAAKKHDKVKPQLVARYAGLDERATRNAMRRLARKVERKKWELEGAVERRSERHGKIS